MKIVWLSVAFLLASSAVRADDELIKIAPTKVVEKKDVEKTDGKLPLTKLAPAKLFPPLGMISYPITTSSPKCQAYFDQGLNYFYSYVWIEAARSFETALQHDPDCAIAHWALSRAIDKWGKAQAGPSLAKAKELLPKASHRESLLIKARLADKGLIDGIALENRKKEAIKYLDELLTLYDDDQEAWFNRAQLAEGPNGPAPFYKALLRVAPLHAGAHHELIHLYEGIKRPALGWPHGLKYIESAGGIPHAYHMQSHLATRIGKWEKTADWSSKAIELQRAYHKDYNLKVEDDWQYSHHLETLTLSLIHDGRFQEARKTKALSEAAKYSHPGPWFLLHLSERDWDAALKSADLEKKVKWAKSYKRALVFLEQGDLGRAVPEINVLQEAFGRERTNKTLELRLYEVQGMLLCRQGQADNGLKLLEKTVMRTKDDYGHHSWGRGASFMERWGIEALRAGKLEVAEEAFLEALAHDAGSVRGALGMQILCERQGRSEEAARFADLAARCWRRADPGRLDQEREALRAAPIAAVSAR